MKPPAAMALQSTDTRASIAVDLGAESCRVSLLRWTTGIPSITLVHRFTHAARELEGSLRWDLAMIEAGLDEGVRRCAAVAEEGVRSIAVDGWAVDYVRVDADCKPLGDPFCYRDERTVNVQQALHKKISPDRLWELTGIQPLRINTLYQLHADALQGLPEASQWLNLPEYILSRWGGSPVAEYTTATHTGLMDFRRRQWSPEIFTVAQLDPARAPKIVPPGTELGKLRGPLSQLPALCDTMLIAPACHDTASAIAGIPSTENDWAYISSGTWSLVGTLMEKPRNEKVPVAEGFSNLGSVGNQICFHKNVNGMWLIKQCLDEWSRDGREWTIPELVAAGAGAKLDELLDIDDPELMLPGRMPQRINAQRARVGLTHLDEGPNGAPTFAKLIFYSLAAQYAKVLEQLALHTKKRFKRIFIVGGGSQNGFLNKLTQEATGLEVCRGSVESSTVGNFAVQLAVLEGDNDSVTGVGAARVAQWAEIFAKAMSSG